MNGTSSPSSVRRPISCMPPDSHPARRGVHQWWSARCPGHGGTSRTRVQALGSPAAALAQLRAAKCDVASVPLIPLLAPWVSVVVVAEAGGVLKHQLDAADLLWPISRNATHALPSNESSSGRLVLNRRSCEPSRNPPQSQRRQAECPVRHRARRAVVDAFTGTMAIHSLHLIKLLRLVGLWV